MEKSIKKAIEGGYSIQMSYYVKPVKFISIQNINDYYTVFNLDDSIVVEDEKGEQGLILSIKENEK